MEIEYKKSTSFINMYRDHLFDIVEYFSNKLTSTDFSKGIINVFQSTDFIIGLMLIIYMTLITFCGIKIERISLSVFVGTFMYTLAYYFIGPIKKITPGLIAILPEPVKKILPKDIENNIYWISLIISILGIIIFLFIFNIVKIVAILFTVYIFYDYLGKNYIDMPQIIDITNKIVLAILIITFYCVIKFVFTFIFTLMFVAYGGIFVLGFYLKCANKFEYYHKFCITLFYNPSAAELKNRTEFFYYLLIALLGFVVQKKIL